MLKSLYSGYFQKSKAFLYPALLIPRGISVTPINTYVSWDGYYSQSDCKLMVLYHLRSDVEFKSLEKKYLFSNPMFQDFYEIEDGKAIYVFDFQDHKDDFEMFINGKYSKISQTLKKLIIGHYTQSKKYFVHIDSFINPEMYYDIYSKLLSCDKKILMEVVELCDKPDLEKENLQCSIKNLELKDFNITSL